MTCLLRTRKLTKGLRVVGFVSALATSELGCSGADDKAAPAAAATGSDAGTTSSAPDAATRGVTWPSGTDGLDPAFFTEFGSWRGLPATSSWVNVHWLKWEWLTAPGLASSIDGKTLVRVWEMVQDWNGLVVLSMSMAGPDDLSQAEYDAAMVSCARGEFDAEWRTFASNATTAGRTGKDTVLSLAHEFNGTWFPWNPATVGQETWTACWRNVYTAIKSASDLQIIWVMSASSVTTKGGDYAVNTAWDAYPGDAYVDIIGVNRYDFTMLGSRDQTDWKKTCANTQDLCFAADYARKHNKKLGVPEWSVERGEFGYSDNPNFIDFMHKFFVDNQDVLAFENNFNNGGLGEWHLYPPESDNEKSAARYKELW
jgi:hypothetical protein